jgi:hypothetical protein
MIKRYFLHGYYPPTIEECGTIEKWEDRFSMGPSAEVGWVWFEQDYYRESEITDILKTAENVWTQEDYDEFNKEG